MRLGLFLCGWMAGWFPAVALAASPARISGVYFNGYFRGEPEEAIRITNTDEKSALDLGGFVLTDAFLRAEEPPVAPGERARSVTPAEPVRLRLPEGVRVAAGQDVWVARKSKAFARVFGMPGAAEAEESDGLVPNTAPPGAWLNLPAHQGVVALLSPAGEVVDLVAYDSVPAKQHTALNMEAVPVEQWTGPPVMLTGALPMGWAGVVLARDRSLAGALVADTHTALDWNSGFSVAVLGQDALHRIEMPGQTRVAPHRWSGVNAKVTVGSAPENQFQVLVDALGRAKRHVRINIYQFTSPHVADRLMTLLGRGVKVTILLEGSPVAGIPDDERVLMDQLAKAGATVWFLAKDPQAKEAVRPSYQFNHAKYALVDDRLVVMGTENYGSTGHPVDPSRGNRGYTVAIEHPGLVAELQRVFDADTRPGREDLVNINAYADDAYGLPTKEAGHVPSRAISTGLYPERRKPLVVEGPMDLEWVLSPDNSLSETTGVLGMMARAKTELLVLQNSIPRSWGKGAEVNDQTPNLPLMAVLAAARRGVMVRVLVDGTEYNTENNDTRDNDDTVRFINDVARREGLNMAAKILNLEAAALEKIHAKGVLVDGRETLVSSINWTENSFKGNREVGVVLGHPKINAYYASLFWRDWNISRIYRTSARAADVNVWAEPLLGSKVLKKVGPKDVLEVLAERPRMPKQPDGFLEVRVDAQRVGYVLETDVAPPLATPAETRTLVGRQAVVEGRVLEVVQKGSVLALGLDLPERAVFQLVVFKEARTTLAGQLGTDPALALKGKKVRVRGTITRYKGPQIELKDAKQLDVLD